MRLTKGARVRLTMTMGVARTGTVVRVHWSWYLDEVLVDVEHDDSVPDPLDLTRQRSRFTWPSWMVRPESAR